jgi:hypothetical protein
MPFDQLFEFRRHERLAQMKTLHLIAIVFAQAASCSSVSTPSAMTLRLSFWPNEITALARRP